MGCIWRSCINKHSLPLDPHTTQNLYLPNFITLKIPSNLHHPPNHRFLLLLLAYNFLKDEEHNGKQFIFQNKHKLHLPAFFLPVSPKAFQNQQIPETFAKAPKKKTKTKTIEKFNYS